MHSRIYVLRQIEDGKSLPPMSDRNCVTEDEFADSFVPSHADYVSLVRHDKHWYDDAEWLVGCYKDILSLSEEKDDVFITLDNHKGLAHLKEMYKRFQEAASKVTEADFCAPYSMNMYDMQEAINDESGFWIITITNNSGWWYDTMDSFLRTHCGVKDIPNKTKFRLEDVFDYHY